LSYISVWLAVLLCFFLYSWVTRSSLCQVSKSELWRIVEAGFTGQSISTLIDTQPSKTPGHYWTANKSLSYNAGWYMRSGTYISRTERQNILSVDSCRWYFDKIEKRIFHAMYFSGIFDVVLHFAT